MEVFRWPREPVELTPPLAVLGIENRVQMRWVVATSSVAPIVERFDRRGQTAIAIKDDEAETDRTEDSFEKPESGHHGAGLDAGHGAW